MKATWLVVFTLLTLSTSVGAKKKGEYHWKPGMVSILHRESQRLTPPQTPDQAVPPDQIVIETWTYKVVGEDGTYVVKSHPNPFTRQDGVKVLYDVDGKVMHINASPEAKKVKTIDLDIVQFSPR